MTRQDKTRQPLIPLTIRIGDKDIGIEIGIGIGIGIEIGIGVGRRMDKGLGIRD